MGNDLQLIGLDLFKSQYSHMRDVDAGQRSYDLGNPFDARDFAEDVLDGRLDGRSRYEPGEEWSGVTVEGSTVTAGDKRYDLRNLSDYAQFMRDAGDGRIDGQITREQPGSRVKVPSHAGSGAGGDPLDAGEAGSLAKLAQDPRYALVDGHWERTRTGSPASSPPGPGDQVEPEYVQPPYVETRDHGSNTDYASWTREDWKKAIKADPEKYTALFAELAMTEGGLSDDVTEHMTEVQQFVGAELQRFNRDMLLLKSIQDANHETLKALAQIRV